MVGDTATRLTTRNIPAILSSFAHSVIKPLLTSLLYKGCRERDNDRMSNMLKTPDPLEDELGKYENKWVAIDEDERKVVGSGDNALEAKREAESNGHPDAALFKVRAFGKLYVYST